MATEREMVGTRVPDGVQMGLAATDKIAFFGSAPVVQQTAATAVTGYHIIASTDTTTWGMDSSANMALLCNDVKAMHTTLANLGLMA